MHDKQWGSKRQVALGQRAVSYLLWSAFGVRFRVKSEMFDGLLNGFSDNRSEYEAVMLHLAQPTSIGPDRFTIRW
jgi:hypothetical protein